MDNISKMILMNNIKREIHLKTAEYNKSVAEMEEFVQKGVYTIAGLAEKAANLEDRIKYLNNMLEELRNGTGVFYNVFVASV